MTQATAKDITATHDGRSLVGVPVTRAPRLRVLPTVIGQAAKDAAAFDAVCATAPRKPPRSPAAAATPSQSGKLALQRDIRVGAVTRAREGGMWAVQ